MSTNQQKTLAKKSMQFFFLVAIIFCVARLIFIWTAFGNFYSEPSRVEITPNIRRISRNAIQWYQRRMKYTNIGEQASFPCSGKGWICSPKYPSIRYIRRSFFTRSNNCFYPQDVNRWQHLCWQKLRFSIVNPHQAQYCYRADGHGKNSAFQINARIDPHCNRRYVYYTVLGDVNQKTQIPRDTGIIINQISNYFDAHQQPLPTLRKKASSILKCPQHKIKLIPARSQWLGLEVKIVKGCEEKMIFHRYCKSCSWNTTRIRLQVTPSSNQQSKIIW